MRKLLIFLCIAFILITLGAYSIEYVKFKTAETTSSDYVIADDTTAVSVTAAGDCTFGTDINYAGSGSFDAEVKAIGNDYSHFLEKVRPYFESDDLTIVNFEGTLSEGGERADKEYAFRGTPKYVSILTSSSVEAANLANNHTMDYGELALTDTKNILSANNILWFEGNSFGIKYINGIKVGLIGTNTLTYEGKHNFVKNMEELKACGPDLIIASFHWGEELSTAPNSTQMYFAHLAVDNGADLVLGHHPHVLQGIEKYKGKYIVYSLGNFSFGGNKNPSDKDTMIFKQTFRFKDGKLIERDYVSIVPCSISSVTTRNNYQPAPLSGEEFERVKNKITELSAGFDGIENIRFAER